MPIKQMCQECIENQNVLKIQGNSSGCTRKYTQEIYVLAKKKFRNIHDVATDYKQQSSYTG